MLPPRAEHLKSPCCFLPLLNLPLGALQVPHWRCSECQRLWIWAGHRFLECESQTEHRKISGVAVTRQPGPEKTAG